MAYSTQYGKCRFDKPIIRKKKFGWIAALALLIAVLLLQMIYPAQMKEFREAALPFFEEDVQSALLDMAKDIKEGMAPGQAVKAFCEEIIQGAAA